MNMVLREDSQLLTSWAAGNGEVGNQLTERHFDPVYRFFRNKTRYADVEDLVQLSHRRAPISSRISSLVDLKTSPTGAVAKLEDMHLLVEALLKVSLDAQIILELA